MSSRRAQFDHAIVQLAIAIAVTLGSAAEFGSSFAALSHRCTILPLRQSSDRQVLARWMCDLTCMARAFAPICSGADGWLADGAAWVVRQEDFDTPRPVGPTGDTFRAVMPALVRASLTDLPPPARTII